MVRSASSLGWTARAAVTVIVVGACAVALLATRQGRLQAAHELAQARRRIRAHEERLFDLRARIAEATTPEAVRRAIEAPPAELWAAGAGGAGARLVDGSSADQDGRAVQNTTPVHGLAAGSGSRP